MKIRRGVALLTLLLAPPALADTPTSYTIQISAVAADKDGPKPSTLVHVSLRNNTDGELVVPTERVVSRDYIIELANVNTGLLLQRSARGKCATGEGPCCPVTERSSCVVLSSHGLKGLQPGQVDDMVFDIGSLYDLRPGRYAIIMRHNRTIVAGDGALYSNQFDFTVP